MTTKHLKVLKVDQPIGEFYIGAIKSDELLQISTVDVREFADGEGRTIDGLQRKLSKSRLKILRDYVNLEYATFPTSIILAIDANCVELEKIQGCDGLYDLRVSGWAGDDEKEPIPLEKSAFVIDGQHRLAGLENRDTSNPPFEVNVSIFVGADDADQAEIFSRVNLAQTKVNKSLAYDLLDYANESSPFKTAHDITVALNRDTDGPFFKKIKRLGVRTPGVETETLAQATVVDGLLRHLPSKQDRERSKSLWGIASEPEPNENWTDRVFVNFYRLQDLVSMLMITSNYFDAVRDRWQQPWEKPEEGQILCRTTGYNALSRFLKDAYLDIVEEPRVVTKEEFAKIFAKVQLTDKDLTKERFVPGSTGASELYKILILQGLEGNASDQV